ncbi:uncharacterized protein RCC_02566 [Ramularia collo-cygni]|uniref:Transcription initiation factor IIF subunit beta n=1 Tax=Ramularia collo-cygni TaxID=112498 RepID=A0A2D3UNU1_9PEZI|nr:uncharacterized protein RCC_02566 [Ramularia collo-cygni]CZT16731.1 uncharacterized protein RCC_02566 [Ramularia collo-cygni]
MSDIAMKNEVKPEIKQDGGSPSKLDSIEAFEDDHDLHIPPTDPPIPAWLVKLSQDHWKAWNDIHANAPYGQRIEVGMMRVYDTKPGEQEKVQIRLNDIHPQHRALPKVYNLDIKNTGHKNTIVFSEKDLPGHRSAPFGSTRTQNHLPAGKPTGIPSKGDRYGPKKPGSYRTAIPKQTALAPPIAHEAVANPVDDDSSLDFFKQSYTAALNGANKATFSNSVRGISWHPGSVGPNLAFGTMTSKPGKSKNNKKPVKDKAVRMEKVQLLDAIQNCFREYQYWSSKALRTRLQQPEAYIKETLEEIAVLVKSGDFVSTYKLKPDYQRLNDLQAGAVKDEMAPVEDSDDGTGDELGDDDDDMGFEDVEMKSQ